MDAKKMEAAFRASHLITCYLEGTLTPAQEQELAEWLAANNDNRVVFDTFTSPALLNELLKDFSRANKKKKAALHRLRRRLFASKGRVLRLTAKLWRYVA